MDEGDGEAKLESRRQLAQVIIRSLKLTWEASPRYTLLVALGTLVGGLLPAVVLALSRQFIDLAVQSNASAAVPASRLLAAGLFVAVATASSQLIGEVTGYLRMVATDAGRNRASQALVVACASADMTAIDRPSYHDEIQRADQALNWKLSEVQRMAFSVSQSVVGIAGLAVLLLIINPWLIPLTVAASAIPLWTERPIQKELFKQWHGFTPKEREMYYLRHLLTERENAKEVRAGGLGPTFIERFTALMDQSLRERTKLYMKANLRFTVTALFTALLLTGSYALVANSHASAGSLAAVFGAIAGVTSNLSGIVSSFIEVELHGRGLSSLFKQLDRKPKVASVANPTAVNALDPRGIRFEGVVFQYPEATKPALDGLDLEVVPGEMLALVGENGAGKSTLVNLLLRFYDADAGRVLVGGVDLRDADPEQLRSKFGVLFQDFATYFFSAKENIALGKPGVPVDEEQLELAMLSAQAGGLVKKLPRGLDSKLGNVFEGGTEISGGEWQRLALARLFYRDADVWILDEPTSSLDAAAEAAIFAQLRDKLHGRIGIVISHRFSTVRIADRIAVMDAGKIIELGTHSELVARGGRYAELFELQAAGYR